MANAPERSFVDANILVYAAMEQDPRHDLCRRFLEEEDGLCLSSQVLAEFYAVTTNPRRVSAPFTAAEAATFVEELASAVAVLPLPETVVPRWLELARDLEIVGADIFDVQIVATMAEHGVRRIYTYNTADFASFTNLEVLTPQG